MNVATFFVVRENLDRCTYEIRVVIHDVYSGGFQDITEETYNNLVTAVMQNIVNGVSMPSIANFGENIFIDLIEHRGNLNALFQFYNVVLGSCIPDKYFVEQSILVDNEMFRNATGDKLRFNSKTDKIVDEWKAYLKQNGRGYF